MRKEYPGGRTLKQWRLLSDKERNAWVAQEKCDRLGLWVACTKKRRCRRHRTCRGNQFDCYWQYREKLSPAECAREDAKFAPRQAVLDIGPSAAP